MLAESVRTESKTLPEMIAALPEAISTIMVSPTDRASPSRIPAATPAPAAGNVTVHAVCQRVAPSAKEASRNERGTARSASSQTE